MDKNSWVRITMLLLALGYTFGITPVVYAHGVIITYTLKTNGQIELAAEFDTGEVMSEGQVTIYSPADPLNPWLVGTADALGHYVFVLDPDLLGTWDIQVRKAGHGDIIHIPLEVGMIDLALVEHPPGELTLQATEPQPAPEPARERTTNSTISSGGNNATAGGFSSLQILLMSGSIIWGFVGTALYFSNKKTPAHDHSHPPGHQH